MARLVKCPECHKVLVEDPNIPVYKCAGCGTILHAKNRNADGETVAPGSLQTNHPESPSDHGFSDSASPISVREMIPSPSTMQSSEVENEEAGIRLPSMDSPRSNVEDNHNVEEGGSQASRLSSRSTNFAAANQQDQGTRDDKAYDFHEQVENPLKLSKPDCLILTHEVEQSPDSVGHSIASEEDMVDKAQDILKSPSTISSHAYYGSISSDDGCIVHTCARHRGKSQGTFRHHRTPEKVSNKEIEGEDALGNNKKFTCTEAKLKSKSLASNLLSERNGSGTKRSFNAIRGDISSKCERHELEGGSSFDPNELQRIQNWMKLGKDGPSGILPEGSLNFDLHDKMELLRKIDEVRDQLTKLCFPREDTRRQPSSGMHDKQQFDQPFHKNFLDHPSHASYARVNQFPMKHGQSYCSCLHCLEEWQLHMLPNFHGHGTYRANVHDLEKSHLKNKPKHHCRPISGAVPFVICYKCMKLLQLPADLLISRRKVHKLQCGACAEVLDLSFPGRTQTLSEVVHSSIIKKI